MKKKVWGLILAAAMTAALMGCSSKAPAETEMPEAEAPAEPTTEAPAEAEKPEAEAPAQTPADTDVNNLEGKKIAVLLKSYTDMFWVEAANEAKLQGEKYGCEVEILAPTVSNSNEEQIQLIENSLVSPPDLYVIVPADSEGIAPAIQAVNDAGIPIVNVNTKITDESVTYDTYVSCSQYDLGYTTISTAIEKIGGEGKAIIIFGKPGAQTFVERNEGAEDAFKEHAGWEVLANEIGKGTRNDAMTVMQTLLTKYPEIDMVYAQNGEMALGVVEAIKQAGRTDEIKVAADNCNSEICQAIEDGSIYMTYDDGAWAQMEMGFKAANMVLGGETVEKTYYSDIYLVDADNVTEYAKRYEE